MIISVFTLGAVKSVLAVIVQDRMELVVACAVVAGVMVSDLGTETMGRF